LHVAGRCGIICTSTTTTMSAKLGNLLCFVIAASAFAMIGLDATAHHGSTHSGTQEYVRHD